MNSNRYLLFMEPCIARCVFYITKEMQLIQCSLLLSALYIHTSGRQQENMTIPKAAHTVLYAPDDGRKYRPKHVER